MMGMTSGRGSGVEPSPLRHSGGFLSVASGSRLAGGPGAGTMPSDTPPGGDPRARRQRIWAMVIFLGPGHPGIIPGVNTGKNSGGNSEGPGGAGFLSVRATFQIITACLVLLLLAGRAAAVQLSLDPPGQREFVRDLADLLHADAEAEIRQICDTLLTDLATPIIVVTINSMADHGGHDMRLETFATLLFDQWEIGHAQVQFKTSEPRDWNTGILLLVSKGDRRARIELGAGWGHREDQLCQQIMDEQIIYHFKQGRYDDGILAGVTALDKMARKLELPTRPRPWWHYGLIVGLTGLGAFTVVSLIRRGASGWAWLFWGAVFTLLGVLLYQFLASQSRGGGFSGGSLGGGYSGGGGASGSW